MILDSGRLEVTPLKRKLQYLLLESFSFNVGSGDYILDASHWLKNQDLIEYDISVATLYDDLTRAMHSSWWEWLDGSQLFFWSWPSIWMKEDRYGAHTFNLYFTLPKLRLYFPPIKKVD